MTHRNVPRSYQMLKYNKNTRGIKMCYEMWNWKETIKKYHSKKAKYCISRFMLYAFNKHKKYSTKVVLRFVWSYFILLIYLRAF